jgi:putative ABC transport system substrate-binding protein
MSEIRWRRAALGLLAVAILFAATSAHAQSPPPKYRLGFLSPASAATMASRVDAMVAGLRDLGYAEGRDFTLEFRWADGNDERLPALAAELTALKVDIVLAHGAAAVRAAHAARSTTPVICAPCGDMGATGLVASLSRPGGSVTGLTIIAPETTGKRLEILKSIMPGVSRLGVMWNPGRTEALIVLSDAMLYGRRKEIADLAIAAQLPTVSFSGGFAQAGGLIGYGPDLIATARRIAVYVDKIVKGARPSELPIEQPTKFELVVNLKTARVIGLTVPRSVVVRADEVIE